MPDAPALDAAAAPAPPRSARAAPRRDDDPLATFVRLVDDALRAGTLARLGLRHPGPAADADLERWDARPVQLKGQPHLQAVWRHATRDVTKNLALPGVAAALRSLLHAGAVFAHAHLQTTERRDVQLRRDRRGAWRLQVGKLPGAARPAPATVELADDDDAGDDDGPSLQRAVAGRRADGARALDFAHDLAREHPVPVDAPFLLALGVTDDHARVKPTMARKWRQINKFVEIALHAIDEAGLAATRVGADAPLRIVDIGAGRGYLTLALHDALRRRGLATDIVGLELRAGLVDELNAVIARLRLDGVRFETGDAADEAEPAAPLDMLVALHACDTATDHALVQGVRAGAAVIVASPCCHRQLRPQLKPTPTLAPLLEHGIHAADFAEMTTDTLRALALRARGWRAQVFEFISPEHTQKNRMLLAIRPRPTEPSPRDTAVQAARNGAAAAQAHALMATFGIAHQAAVDALIGPAPDVHAPDDAPTRPANAALAPSGAATS